MSILTILLLLLGLALVVFGSDYLVDGSAAIARRSGLSEFLIGLTIVGIGTSTPEMVVSFISALRGQADMSIGNIIGSNIFNTYLILGLTAVILPVSITKSNIRRDIPLNIGVTLMLILLGMNFTIFGMGRSDELSRIDGALMLVCFVFYLHYSFKNGKQEQATEDDSQAEEADEQKGPKSVFAAVIMVIGGLAALIFGGELFVNNATVIARYLGWSDKFIGITVLAMGTSLPELATCIVAAAKKKGQMALGNIIGSNISNILLILGGSALIRPLEFGNITIVDMAYLLFSAVMLLLANFCFEKRKLGRVEGILMLLIAISYFTILAYSL